MNSAMSSSYSTEGKVRQDEMAVEAGMAHVGQQSPIYLHPENITAPPEPTSIFSSPDMQHQCHTIPSLLIHYIFMSRISTVIQFSSTALPYNLHL